jgi:hypothetical protein
MIRPSRRDYAKAKKEGIEKYIKDLEAQIERKKERGDDEDGMIEYLESEKEKFEAKLKEVESQLLDEPRGDSRRDLHVRPNPKKDSEYSEMDWEIAKGEGCVSPSERDRWITDTKAYERFIEHVERERRLAVIRDLWSVGLDPKEVYGVQDAFLDLLEGREESGDTEPEEEDWEW